MSVSVHWHDEVRLIFSATVAAAAWTLVDCLDEGLATVVVILRRCTLGSR